MAAVTAVAGTDGLLRRAARMATRLKGELDVVHVASSDATRPGADRLAIAVLRPQPAGTGARDADWGGGESVVGLVLVDQDGTIADFERPLLAAFRAKHPAAPFIDVADRREVSARKQYGAEWGPAVDAIMKTEGFYLSLPVITGAPRACDEMLEAGHEVFVCTSPLSGTRWCIPEKLAWVQKHLGESWVDRVIIIKDKTLVGDPLRRCILIDDRPGVDGLVKPPSWRQVLFDAPYNRTAQGPRLTSWADWRRVLSQYL